MFFWTFSTSFQLCWISGLVVFWIGSTCPRSPRVSTFTDDTRCYCQTNNGLPAWIRHSLILVGTQSQQNFPDCATSSTALFSLAKKIPWKLWSCCSLTRWKCWCHAGTSPRALSKWVLRVWNALYQWLKVLFDKRCLVGAPALITDMLLRARKSTNLAHTHYYVKTS